MPPLKGVDGKDPFEPDRMLWIRWPAMDSFGLLWIEFQGADLPFKAAWNHTALRKTAAVWREANPKDVDLLTFQFAPPTEPEEAANAD